ncbi:putative trans-sialidase [Trypanosoma cruzi]|nr:putative trans-sialidase [Trypanosoma cruzi]
MSGLINVELLQGVDPFVPRTTLVQLKGGIVPVTTRDSFASPSLVSAGGVIAAFAEGHMDAEYQGVQLSKPFSSAFVAGCIDSVWNWSTVVGEVNERMHGGRTLWLVQRRERRVCVLCSAAQQSRRATEFFLLREALMCPTKVGVGERTAWSRNWLWAMPRIPRVASRVNGSNVATPNHSRS